MDPNPSTRYQHPPELIQQTQPTTTVKTRILEYLIHLKQTTPYPDETIRVIQWTLTRISNFADLDKPDQVNNYIASQRCSNNYKRKLVQNYSKFLEYQNIPYKRPYYTKDSKPIRIPTKERLEMLIANAGRTMSKKLQLSLETGLRPIELMHLKVKDIDLTQHLVYPTTAKNGASRTLKITDKLSTILQKHIIANKLKPNDQLFKGDSTHYGKEYRETRNYLAQKLNDPTIQTIRLYDFRHYFATMLYAKTNNILYVKQQMGHKRIDTTLIYTQLLENIDPDYLCEATDNTERAKELVKTGYEYVNTVNEQHLYRKRKI